MVVADTRLGGRGVELARLEESWADVLDGRPVMYAIGGDTGGGKSRLVREFLGRAAAGGATGLVGACLDLAEGSLPFWPFVAAIREYTTSLDDAERTPEASCRRRCAKCC